MNATLNARINARRMPRERAEHAVRELALLQDLEIRIYEGACRAFVEVAEDNIGDNWGVYREDVGVDGRELDRIIERDAWQVGSEAVARALPDLEGRRAYLTALRNHALNDWAAQLGMPFKPLLLLEHLHFSAGARRMYHGVRMPYLFHLRYTVASSRTALLGRRALPAPERAA